MPPASAIDAAATASVTPGAASSSVIVSVAPVTLPAPWLLPTVPVTVTRRSGSSVVLFTAATVATSMAFTVLPAAITISASDPAV